MEMITMVQYATQKAKNEILQDIENGIVPAHVSSFSELHDYVDANEYGGLCEDAYWCLPDDATEAEIEANDGVFLLHQNESEAVQNAVNLWLENYRR